MDDAITPIWLDCDPGNDDAMAIILAAFNPKIKLIGLSTTKGNAGIERTTINACNILWACGATEVDIVKGADTTLCYNETEKTAEHMHGELGLGTNKFENGKFKPLEETAIIHMNKVFSSYPSKITLVVTGPMTNTALLFRVFPKVKGNIEKIVLMGGAITKGNVTPAAEFNLFCDPEAAEVVFNSGVPVYMVPLEVTHTAQFMEDQKKRMQQMNTKFSEACIEMLEFYKDAYKTTQGFEFCPLHDPCAVAYCIAPEIFKTVHCRVEVEVEKSIKGKTVCDIESKSEKKKNVNVVMDMDFDKFWELMLGAVEQASEKSRIEEVVQ
jgi:inosine-uridine nucleoside N-ribohydrolase